MRVETFQAGIEAMNVPVRGIGWQTELPDEQKLWGIFYQEDFANLLDTNPLYINAPASAGPEYRPNQLLVDTLCQQTLAGHPNLRALEMRIEAGEPIEQGDRHIAIVNALPYPIGEHLRKLLCPVDEEEEGYDKVGPERLTQIGLSYHTSEACHYLQLLRERSAEKYRGGGDLSLICRQAEKHLSAFFAELHFMSKYALISIQDIDVQKYRHSRAAQYSHRLVRLMRAMGKNETSYFLLKEHLDNRGLLFIKGNMRPIPAAADGRPTDRREYTLDNLEYLNISPFIIDRNAFEAKTDLTNLYRFDSFIAGSGEYWFRPVKKPAEQQFVLGPQPEFEPVRLQLEAFRQRVLGEQLD